MTACGEYWVRFEGEDALLFQSAPDGTVTLLAIPRREWEHQVCSGSGSKVDDQIEEVVYQTFLADATRDRGHVRGSERTAERFAE